MLFIITSVNPILSKNLDFNKINENLDLNKKNIYSASNNPVWVWAVKGGGFKDDYGESICVDSNGSTYTIGHFEGPAKFGSVNLTSQGDCDIFVVKLDKDGNWQWVKSEKGWNGAGICVDSNGYTYITADSDNLVSKLDKDGSLQWAISAEGVSGGTGICVDSSINTYVIGSFIGYAKFGSIKLTSIGNADIFVAKLDKNRYWKWAINAGGTKVDNGRGIAVDGNGNTYITGLFEGSATFGSTTLTSYGDLDVFIAKIDTNGVWQWVKNAGGTGRDYGFGVAVDQNGNTYINGYFNGSATFGNTTLTSNGYNDGYVAKLNTNGDWQWAKNAGEPSGHGGNGVAEDVNGNTYITGYFNGSVTFGNTTLTSKGCDDVFVAKLDTDGNWQWVVQGGGNYLDRGDSICVDSNGNIYITGDFFREATFGITTLIGYCDAFIAKLRPLDQPPNTPKIFGPRMGRVRADLIYKFTSSDTEKDKLSYYIEWGDGNNTNWTTLQNSSTFYKEKHIWSTKGDYTIKAEARDSCGAESDWGSLKVIMPQNQIFIADLFERFSNMFPILQKILNRLV